MIPLAIFLGIWLLLVLINGILTLITLGQFFKYATPSLVGYGNAIIFIAVAIATVIGCGSYFLNVDWEQKIDVIPASIQSFITGEHTVEDTLLEP
jgi:hypothetical protein